MTISLGEFLQNKPLYYEKIDYERMPNIYKKIKNNLPHPKIIHVVGTNGKGTTGRFLSSALHHKGFNVGHYTSPHILKFNERIWKNGSDANDEALEVAHKKLSTLLSKEDADALSYFEYTTLLAMLVFEGCKYVVLEAGLGGEHDATSVFESDLTLFTPIDYDHQAFLGDTIEAIAKTKLHVMVKKAIIGFQKHAQVYEIASKIAQQKQSELIFAKESDIEIKKIAQALSLPLYLQENLTLAALALLELGFEVQAEDFKDARLFGRLSKIAPNVILDVGHNPLAAQAIADSLAPEKFTLIYNSYKDKDFKTILEILKPIIKSIEIIEVDDARIVDQEILISVIEELGLTCRSFRTIDAEENYLVFGSLLLNRLIC